MKRGLVVGICVFVLLLIILIIVFSSDSSSTGEAVGALKSNSLQGVSKQAELGVIFSTCDGGAESCLNVYSDGSSDCGNSGCGGAASYSAPSDGCGDVNNDGLVNIMDITYLIVYLYKGGPAPVCDLITSCADVNADELINIMDITYLIVYLYKGGPEPNCGGEFDLRLTDLFLDDTTPEVGQEVVYHYSVENIGEIAGYITGFTTTIANSQGGSSSGGGSGYELYIEPGQMFWYNNSQIFNVVGLWNLTKKVFGHDINNETDINLWNNQKTIYDIYVSEGTQPDEPEVTILESYTEGNTAYVTVSAIDPLGDLWYIEVWGPRIVNGSYKPLRDDFYCAHNASCYAPLTFEYDGTYDLMGDIYLINVRAGSGRYEYYVELVFDVENQTQIPLGCDEATQIYEGEENFYGFLGGIFEISINYIGPSDVKFEVNGELTNSLELGQSYVLVDGTSITVEDILYSSQDNVTSSAYFSLWNDSCGNQTNDSCFDSDGGLNFYTYGEIFWDGLYLDSDSCSGDILTEFSCIGGVHVHNEAFECPNGCENGACVGNENWTDSYKIEKTSTKFNLGDYLGEIVSVSLGDDHLPNLLADGEFVGSDSVSYSYTQKIDLNHSLRFSFWEDSDYLEDVPTLGMRINGGDHILDYTFDFSSNPAFNSSLEQAEINLLAKSFYIYDVAESPYSMMLLGPAKSSYVYEGETVTVDVEGTSYEVKIIFISSSEVKLEVNGELTNTLFIGETYRLSDGSYVAITEIWFGGPTSGVTFVIGKDKLELTHGNNMRLNDNAYSDITVYLDVYAGGLSNIRLIWTVDDDTFVAPASEVIFPYFNTMKLNYDGFYTPYEETFEVRAGGSSYWQLDDFPLKTSVEDINILYTDGNTIIGIGKDSDDRLVTGVGSITFDSDTDDYFVASWNNLYNSQSYLMRATTFTTENGTDKTTFQYKNDGVWTVVKANAVVGDNVTLGDVGFYITNLSNVLNEVTILKIGNNVRFDKLFSKQGLEIFLPTSAAINFGVDTSYDLLAREENKNDNIGSGGQMTFTLGLNPNNEASVENIQGSELAIFVEVGESDVYENYLYTDLATKFLWDKSGDQYSSEATYHGSESYGNFYVIASNEEFFNCKDSDGGLTYYLYGYAEKGDITLYDYCVDNSSNLSEAYCHNNNPSYALWNCPYGCSGGVCQQETRGFFGAIGDFFSNLFGGGSPTSDNSIDFLIEEGYLDPLSNENTLIAGDGISFGSGDGGSLTLIGEVNQPLTRGPELDCVCAGGHGNCDVSFSGGLASCTGDCSSYNNTPDDPSGYAFNCGWIWVGA